MLERVKNLKKQKQNPTRYMEGPNQDPANHCSAVSAKARILRSTYVGDREGNCNNVKDREEKR